MPETAAFTPAPKNRPLQALFAAIFIVPQLAVYAVQDDHSAYEELASLFRPVSYTHLTLPTTPYV